MHRDNCVIWHKIKIFANKINVIEEMRKYRHSAHNKKAKYPASHF